MSAYPGLNQVDCAKKLPNMCFYPEFSSFVSLEAIIGGHLSYVVVIFALKQFMKNREAYNPKLAMMIYNVTQVILSVTMTIAMAPYLLNGFFNLKGKFVANIEFWIFVHYLTKYLDMFDTVWMVLRKKDRQISFLHVYHHLTIGAIWGLLLHYNVGNGTAFFGAWINSLVHSLMYFHYFITSLKFENPLKKYLTQFQMLQFSLCICHAVAAPLLDDQIPLNWCILQLCYHATLLALFADFYRREIAGKKAARRAKAE